MTVDVSIPLSRPYLTGKELGCIEQAILSLSFGGDGSFSKKCAELLESLTGSPVFLTPSGTHAIELALMALGLDRDDEVILPSYAFSSCATAVVQMGLKPVFIDVREDTFNIDESLIEGALTPKTKAVLAVHYAGVAAEMDPLLAVARKHGLEVIEDAAQAVHSFYKGRHLGSLGDLGIFSFHHTKNVTSGKGGAIVVNSKKYLRAIEIHRQKGTDRSRFLRGEVNKYRWIDRGSSYLISDILAAFLFPQLEVLEEITTKRKAVAEAYLERLSDLSPKHFRLPVFPSHCRPNYHAFPLLLNQRSDLEGLKGFLQERGIEATGHFAPLHNSPGGKKFGVARGPVRVAEKAGECLLRLPLYPQMTREEQDYVIDSVNDFFKKEAASR
jgi:dTDP-4-amino-4,6-dideoxygalactose transaminase